jgi:hypothetical protein
VGLKRKGAERKVEQRVVMEDVEKGLMAPLEVSDEVMEQVEAMAKELRKRIWALVEGVGRLTEVVEGMGKKEVAKVDKETEMEGVQRVDKQTEMEKKVEDSEEDEESKEGEKEDKEEERDNGKEDKEEDEEESDRTEDREEEGGK